MCPGGAGDYWVFSPPPQNSHRWNLERGEHSDESKPICSEVFYFFIQCRKYVLCDTRGKAEAYLELVRKCSIKI